MKQSKIEMCVLARYLSGKCTVEQKEAVEQWIDARSENRQKFKEYERIWEASATPLENSKEGLDAETDWNKLRDSINQSTNTRPAYNKTHRGIPFFEKIGSFWLLRVAAIFLVAAFIGIFAYVRWEPGKKTPSLQKITTKMGQRVHLTLSDGTTVLLNAGSEIKMPKVFEENKREVFLQGQAYFQVAKNPDKPFIVHASGAVARDLGTKFSVRAYPSDHEVTVAVKEGRVSFRPGKNIRSEKVILQKYELAQYNEQNQQLSTRKISDMDLYLGWVRGRLKFRNAPMSQVGRALERRYGVRVSFADGKIKSMRLTALLKSRSLPHVLDVISMSLNINYKIKDDRVIFMKH